MSEQFQGGFFPDVPKRKGTEVSRPDDGLCCVCEAPRPEGFRYLCGGCAEDGVSRALTIEAVVAAIRERGS